MGSDAGLGVSHVAILKRWRAIQGGKKVVTNGIGEGLPHKEGRNLLDEKILEMKRGGAFKNLL
jgi:hypothetical protein